MSAEPEVIKLAKANILKVTDKGQFQGQRGPVQMWELVVQNADDIGQVWTATAYRDKLPEGVKLDEPCLVENVDIKITDKKSGDGKNFTLYFSDQGKDGGSGFRRGGYSAPKEDPNVKIVSFAFAYTKDIMLSLPMEKGWDWDEYYNVASNTAAAMKEAYNKLNG